MKSLLATLVFAFALTSAARAEPRQYRLNFSENGYGVGFGVKGKVTDFEQIEQSGKSNEWLDENYDNMQNYLVDTRTNSILAVIGGVDSVTPASAVDGHIGDLHIGNHFGISIGKLSYRNEAGEDFDLVYQSNNWKWSNALSNMFLIKSENYVPKVIARCDDCATQFDNTILAKLSPELQTKYKNYGARDISFTAGEGNGVLDFSIDASVPKEDSPDPLKLQGRVLFQIKGDKISISMENVHETK